MVFRIAIILAFALYTTIVEPTSGQSTQPPGEAYQLKATPRTVAWGYYDAAAKPVLRIKSGDTVEIQTLLTNSPPASTPKCTAPRSRPPRSTSLCGAGGPVPEILDHYAWGSGSQGRWSVGHLSFTGRAPS